MLNDVKEFADKFKQHTNPTPGFLPDDVMKNRLDFQLEELLETAKASGYILEAYDRTSRDTQMSFVKDSMLQPNLAEVLDGLVDQVYVALGTAHAMGFFKDFSFHKDPQPDEIYPIFLHAWHRVHAANMKKELVPGMWKIQKPKGWERPNLEDLVK